MVESELNSFCFESMVCLRKEQEMISRLLLRVTETETSLSGKVKSCCIYDANRAKLQTQMSQFCSNNKPQRLFMNKTSAEADTVSILIKSTVCGRGWARSETYKISSSIVSTPINTYSRALKWGA